jgi:hypothetical protein
MKNPLVSRVLAIVLLTILLATHYHLGVTSKHDMGKEACLAKESESYDASFGSPRITKDFLLAGGLFATMFVMLETTAFLIRKLPLVSMVYRNAHASAEDLTILAYLTIAFGVLSAIAGGFHHKFGSVNGVLDVLIGIGLLWHWRLCRWCSLAFTWLYFLCLPLICMFFLLGVFLSLHIKVEFFDHQFVPSGWYARVIAGFLSFFMAVLWLAVLWTLRVLMSPDVRRLFGGVAAKVANDSGVVKIG